MITAEHIKSARVTADESQAAFGARIGVDQSTVHRWETEGPPKRPLIQTALARALRELAKRPANATADSGASA